MLTKEELFCHLSLSTLHAQATADSWFGSIRDRAMGFLGLAHQKVSDVFKATQE